MTDSDDDESWLNDLPLETPSDFEKAAQEIERRMRPASRARMWAALIRGAGCMGSSALATEGTIARFFLETPPTEMAKFKSATFQDEYFGRFRDWVLYGDSEDVKLLVGAIIGIRPTSRELQAFTSKEFREKLAADLEALAQSDGILIPPRKDRRDSRPFSREEFARFRRAFRFLGPQLADAFEMAKSGDSSGLVESSLQMAFGAPSILLSSPSSKQRFGRRARSPLLLPEDRRRCQFRGCNLAVGNRSRYCREHRQLFETERDRMKKKRARDRARVRRSAQFAESAGRGA